MEFAHLCGVHVLSQGGVLLLYLHKYEDPLLFTIALRCIYSWPAAVRAVCVLFYTSKMHHPKIPEIYTVSLSAFTTEW